MLASLLRSRATSFAIFAVASAQLLLEALHLPGYRCPLLAATGVACPGCGLTRATLALARGDLRLMLELHAFAPALALGLALFTAGAVLPGSWRDALVDRVAAFERRTGITTVLLFALVAYWAVRVVFTTALSAHLTGT